MLDLEQVVQGSQFESAVAKAMRVVILREGLAMEALSISYLFLFFGYLQWKWRKEIENMVVWDLN